MKNKITLPSERGSMKPSDLVIELSHRLSDESDYEDYLFDKLQYLLNFVREEEKNNE